MIADSRTTLYYLSKQLYDDIRFVTQLNPANVVDSETTDSYNLLLKEARTVFPSHGLLRELHEMNPRNVKYKDAIVVAGQLHALLALITGASMAAAQGGDSSTSASGDGQPGKAKGFDTAYEEELYGSGDKKVSRNPDGTIPFSLE